GVAIAIFLYLRDQVRAPVIHRRYTGRDVHSVRHRTKRERKLLTGKGEGIVGCELRGDLFFGTADQLFEELLPELEKPTLLVLNLRRVRKVDLTGAKILQQMGERLHLKGGALIFCEVHQGTGLGHDVAEALLSMSPGSADAGIETFVGSDEALEYAENVILGRDGGLEDDQAGSVRVSDMDICADFDQEMVASLEHQLKTHSYEPEEFVFSGGEPGSELFFVLEGQVDIRLVTTEHHYNRLATYPAGTVFGEVAFLSPGPRSAGAVAVNPTTLASLDQVGFQDLSAKHPDAAIALLKSLSRLQSEEIRWSAREIQRLGDW
ncbi:MAG: cyclic nucleotide-binding domain-containing protein, partial [Acidobacteriota bacterium]|nr:cyclic nucleotide-binding domain-containing protein [Acidobacteriota bacterium]